MKPAWQARERTIVQIRSAAGELSQICPIDPEFWSTDGNIEIGQYIQEHEAYLNARRSERKAIYHYTGLEALQGMVTDGVIWASDVRHLNDRAELSYALEGMYQLSAEIWGAGSNLQPLDAIFRPSRNWQFVSCFSYSRDQLSQWRAYGRKVGIAITFDRDHLESAVNASQGRIVECEYLSVNDFSGLRGTLESILANLKKPGALNSDGALVDMEVQGEATRRVVELATSIKHPSFDEEQEVRLVCARSQVDDATSFRSSPHSLIPYNKIDVDGRRFGAPQRQRYANHLGMLEVMVWPSNVDDQILDAIAHVDGPCRTCPDTSVCFAVPDIASVARMSEAKSGAELSALATPHVASLMRATMLGCKAEPRTHITSKAMPCDPVSASLVRWWWRPSCHAPLPPARNCRMKTSSSPCPMATRSASATRTAAV